jgi:CBS-domain-containing membrane protein
MMGKVKDVMTSEVICARPSTPYKQLVRLMAEAHVGSVPVIDDQRHVLGVVSEADLLLKPGTPADAVRRSVLAIRRRRAQRLKAGGGTAAELMSWPVVTVGPQATVAEAARQLHQYRVKRLPVTDAEGRLVGIVSQADVLKVFLRPDSEIGREIADQVLAGDLLADAEHVQVRVRDGVVLLEGTCERRSRIPALVHAVAGVEGVVRVENRLGYDRDDASSLPHPFSRPLR